MKYRFYTRAKEGLRRIALEGINAKKGYPQFANTKVSLVQVLYWPQRRTYNVLVSKMVVDGAGILHVDDDRMRLGMEAANNQRELSKKVVTLDAGRQAKEHKQARAKEQAEWALTADEREAVEADIFDGKAIPFLKADGVKMVEGGGFLEPS